MTTYTMTLAESAGGVALSDANGRPVGSVALSGDCTANGRSLSGDIINAPGNCDLTKGDEIHIQLDQAGILAGATFSKKPNEPPFAFCINRTQTDKTCLNRKYISKLDVAKKATEVQFTMRKVPNHAIETDIYYSLNFLTKRYGQVMVDPKIINKPRDDADDGFAFLSLTTMVVLALLALPGMFFIGRAIGQRAALSRRG